MPSSRIVGRPDKKSDDGTIPLFLRLSHGGKNRFLSLKIRVKERDWNASKSAMRRSAPEASTINSYLANTTSVAESAIVEMLQEGTRISTNEWKARVVSVLFDIGASSDEQDDFLDYFNDLVDEYERRGQAGTVKAYRSVLRKLIEFNTRARCSTSLLFCDLDVALLKAFETYMIEVRGNKQNTVHKGLGTIRTVLYRAIREGRFNQGDNPFFHIKMKKAKVTKERLDIGDIEKLESLDLERRSTLDTIRDWFLFAFYSGGMRFSDVATLEWSHILTVKSKDGSEYTRVRYKMNKTDEVAGTRLVPQAMAILEKYNFRKFATGGAKALYENRVFSILDGYDLSTPAKRLSAIGTRNAFANRVLKRLQEQAGITQNISFHLARHSLADFLRRKGWSVYDISKMLAHSSISVTERYLKGFDSDDLDEKMESAFG